MSTTTTKELARIDDRTVCNVSQIKTLFDSALPLLRKALPAAMHRSAERIARCAVTEFQKNPELLECTGLSILSCAVQAAQLGLEIGGVTGQSYMVPYWNKKKGVKEAQFQVGYRGMITLAFRGGEVSNIYAECVRERDKFRIIRGTHPGIEHEPVAVNGGPVIGAYAVLVYKSQQFNSVFMSREEVEHHRATYSKQTQSDRSPWKTAWNEMAKKTVIRKLLKHCPLAVELPVQAFNDDAEVPALTLQADALGAAALPMPNEDETEATAEEARGAETEKEAEKTTEPDAAEVAEEKAFLTLLDRKKATWATVVKKINDQFKAGYEQVVPFEEIALDHRRWIVSDLSALPDFTAKKK
jgi:recombination protein RecT